ncbi:hypothetical protein Tco_0408380 [Tanacetum coccineum]
MVTALVAFKRLRDTFIDYMTSTGLHPLQTKARYMEKFHRNHITIMPLDFSTFIAVRFLLIAVASRTTNSPLVRLPTLLHFTHYYSGTGHCEKTAIVLPMEESPHTPSFHQSQRRNLKPHSASWEVFVELGCCIKFPLGSRACLSGKCG